MKCVVFVILLCLCFFAKCGRSNETIYGVVDDRFVRHIGTDNTIVESSIWKWKAQKQIITFPKVSLNTFHESE